MSETALKNQQLIAQYVLNLQGHPFQSRIVEEIIRLSKDGSINFEFYQTEYPVTCRNSLTHVDFIFRDGNIFFIGECKRRYSFTEWCFFKTPFPAGDSYPTAKFVDVLIDYRTHDVFARDSIVRTLTFTELKDQNIPDDESREVFDIGLSLESEKNISRKNSQIDVSNLSNLKREQRKQIFDDTIYQAVNQVLLSSSGFILDLIRHPINPKNHKGRFAFYFVPIIITNANLFTSRAKLTNTDILSGNINEEVQLHKADYVWYNFNRSSQLQPYFSQIEDDSFFGIESRDLIQYNSREQRFSRTILIINSNSLERALSLPFGNMLA